MILQILGAAGAGKSTLGTLMARQTGLPLLHADFYRWQDDQFEQMRPISVRRAMLAQDMACRPSFLLDGGLSSWLPEGLLQPDLLLLVRCPQKTRMERLAQRDAGIFGMGGGIRAIRLRGNQFPSLSYGSAGPNALPQSDPMEQCAAGNPAPPSDSVPPNVIKFYPTILFPSTTGPRLAAPKEKTLGRFFGQTGCGGERMVIFPIDKQTVVCYFNFRTTNSLFKEESLCTQNVCRLCWPLWR